MRTKILSLVAAVLLVAACESTPETAATDGTAGSTTSGVDSAGLGSRSGVSSQGLGAGDAVPGSQRDLEVNVGDRVFFDTDRSDLNGEARETVARQAEWLRRYPNTRIVIEGHADERGTREYNLALGERRAVAVRNYMVALGIPAARVSTSSYGKERPAVVGSNEAAYAQNRRAVTVVN
ncbi:peptidoglycan-associated lipoprotein Pal [Stella sp.]|uniref:peptidoglycan-associated lipoprotein Pal n=1 Tax=Stella sp. TaxID=2912054 RepID=UPI0035B37159